MKKLLMFLSVMSPLLVFSLNSFATTFEIKQVTNNDVNDIRPSLYNGTIAWEGSIEGSNPEIYYWDGSESHRLTNNNWYDRYASLYDGKIAWSGKGVDEIFYWDGENTIQITNNDTYDLDPSLHDGKIAWTDFHNSVLYYDGNSIRTIWQSIYGYAHEPSMYNGEIAWFDFDGSDHEIYYWNGSTVRQITKNDSMDGYVSLYNGTIAWWGLDNNKSTIFYWNGTSTQKIFQNDHINHSNPSLFDGQIAWNEWDGHDMEIFFWDGENVIQITDNEYDDEQPSLYDGNIAWTGFDGNDYEIYYAVIIENQPPVADAGSDKTVDAGPDCMTAVTLDGSGSTDPDDDIVSFEWYEEGVPLGSGETLDYEFALGVHTITLEVTDSFGGPDSDNVTITVQDTTPPEVSVSVTEDSLWPPNRKMVDVVFSYSVSDNCDSEPDVSVEVTSDEPTATAPCAGSHRHAPDAEVTTDSIVFLRAERSCKGDGRVYEITVTVTDESGNSTSSSASVKVNLKKKVEAIDSGQDYDAAVIN